MIHKYLKNNYELINYNMAASSYDDICTFSHILSACLMQKKAYQMLLPPQFLHESQNEDNKGVNIIIPT